MQPHHPMRTVEEVASQMSSASVFSLLEAKRSFWQIKLDHETSLCTAFATPFGRYVFFAHSFQHEFGTRRAMQGIIVGGNGEKEHDENLRKVLNRARQVNRKLNQQKFKFKLRKVSYVGHFHRARIKTRPSQNSGHYRNVTAK